MGSGNQSLRTERDRPSLGPPDDRPGELERGARRRLAGDDELGRHRDVASASRSIASSPSTIAALTRVTPSCWRSQAPGLVASSAAATNSSRCSRRMMSGSSPKPAVERPRRSLSPSWARAMPERGDGLVDRAVGLGPEVVLGDPLAAEQQAGRAVVAAARRDGGCGGSVGRVGIGHRRVGSVTTSGRRRADPSARPAGSP